MRTLFGLGDHVVGRAGLGEFADGGRVQVELASDRRLGHALCEQFVNGGVMLAQPRDDLLLRQGCTITGASATGSGCGSAS